MKRVNATMSPTAVLLDVGGVLLLPDPVTKRRALRPGLVEPTVLELDRAHYRAVAATDAVGYYDREVYRRAYARSCGVPPEQENAVIEEMARVFTGYDWKRVVPGATAGLRGLVATGVAVGIVSNSTGTVHRMLADAGLCQVGPGPHSEVRVIIDSGNVGIEKPDPAIFALAVNTMAVVTERVIYVGDTARIDIDGARRAGLRPVHFDPFGDCPDPAGDHEHVRDLFDVIALCRG